MERGRQIDRDHRVPALFRKLDELRDVLNPGIIDENVDTTELLRGFGNQVTDVRRF